MHEKIIKKLKLYLPLTKSLQTGLLLVTGFAGFSSARCPVMTPAILIGLLGSMYLSVAGSTVLNMIWDRDIDARMRRTAFRPLASGELKSGEAIILALVLSFAGILWAFILSPLYGIIIFAGLFIDVVIYTMWLKRRTAWSIIWGGISGGMPILAGRVLGLGYIDGIGLLLTMAILLWIPTHIMTFSMRYRDDYAKAGVPTFPSAYGDHRTRLIIAISSVGSAAAILIGSIALGLAQGVIGLLMALSLGLLGLAVLSVARPSEKVNFGLFKFASIYMLGAMIMMMVGALG
ncbi:UbiA family prenyltransferase [bacterium]|nr:UbiA family prenyltransferase [bacterium]